MASLLLLKREFCTIPPATSHNTGFPWPNPDCPVALVECDHGEEVRGNINQKTGVVSTNAVGSGSTSYCNLVEARLAIRSES